MGVWIPVASRLESEHWLTDFACLVLSGFVVCLRLTWDLVVVLVRGGLWGSIYLLWKAKTLSMFAFGTPHDFPSTKLSTVLLVDSSKLPSKSKSICNLATLPVWPVPGLLGQFWGSSLQHLPPPQNKKKEKKRKSLSSKHLFFHGLVLLNKEWRKGVNRRNGESANYQSCLMWTVMY